MKKLATIVVGIALLATAANAAPILDYEAEDIGGGLFKYTFTLHGGDGQLKSLATENLVFSGKDGALIQQIAAFGGFVPVNDKGTAEDYHVNPGAQYDMNLDTWLYDGWSGISPDNTNVGAATGDDVTLSVGSGTQTYYEDKLLIQIIANGEVNWEGKISRDGHKHNTNGTAKFTPSGPNGETQGDPLRPNNEGDPERIHNRWNQHGAHGEPAWNRWRFENAIAEGRWYDPPMVGAYLYETTDGDSTFASVMLPVGIDGDGMFIVNDGTGGVPVPEGVAHPFAPGVDSFIVSGIDPLVDSGDPLGFPTFLVFEETDGDGQVSFSMTGIPEPGTLGLILLGAAGLVARRRRRRN